MKISRRNLLVGAAALSASPRAEAWPRHGRPSGVSNFSFGALGGGGYADELALAPDGSSLLERSNLANSCQWKRSTDTVTNISTSPFMDGVGIEVGNYGSPYGHAYGKLTSTGAASNRVCAVVGVMPGLLSYAAFGNGWGQFIRSDDGGATWVKPGPGGTVSPGTLTQPISNGGSGQMYAGPKIAIDPNNDDIIWIQGYNGSVIVTFNAGRSWHIVTGLLDAAGLPKCTVQTNTVVPAQTISCNPNCPINGLGNNWAIFNATNQFCFGGSSGDSIVPFTTSATTFTLAGRGLTRTGAYSPSGGEPSANAGDVIYFGLFGGIVIDPSLGTVANPGIALGDTGATGNASKLIYFSWQSGTTSLWKTETAGGDLTSGNFAAVGSGGPTGNFFKLKLSNDAVLTGGGNNVLWVPDGTNFWRWVRTAPTGSGLSNNTWTSFSPATLFSGQDLTPFGAIPDPTTAGRMAFMNIRAQTNLSTNYGDTPRSGVAPTVTITGGDTTWLNADQPFTGDADFDKIDNLKMWVATGCGLYFGTVPTTAADFNLHGRMQPGLQSMILVSVVKCPAPNGKLILQGQDRNLMFAPSYTQQPSKWFFQPSVVPNTGFGCYALDNPNTMFASVAETYATTDGVTLLTVATFTALGVGPAPSTGPVFTTNGSPTVRFYEPGHSRVNGDVVGIGNLTNFNNITVNRLQKTVTVIDVDNWSVQSATNANATGQGGGAGINGTGVRIGRRGYLGGTGNIVAKTKRLLMEVSGSGNHVLNPICYGTTADDVVWDWNPTLFGGNPITGWGGNAFGKNKPLAIETTTGKIGYIEPNYGDPDQTTANSFFVSSDGGQTLTCPGGTGNLLTNWTGYLGTGTGAQLSCVPGNPTHWLYAQGVPGDGSQNITTQYLRRTRDDGVTWENFSSSTQFVQFVCVGPNPRGGYPSVYIYGLANGDVFPHFGLYRSDDMNGSNTTCTWTKLTNLVRTNCSSAAGLASDYETPGRCILLTADEGYVFSTLS